MPRGRARQRGRGDVNGRQIHQDNEQNEGNRLRTRGQKRNAEGQACVEAPIQQADDLRARASGGTEDIESGGNPLVQDNAGENNIIDFESILQGSGILSSNSFNKNSESLNLPGCGEVNARGSSMFLPQHVSLDSNHTAQNLTFNNLSMPSIRLANDDLAAHVPPSLKQQICKGEYINLALLLKGAVELSSYCKGGVLKISAEGHIETMSKECKDKVSSIEQWTNAFIIYASIYLLSHSDKIHEMLHYMYNIRECALRQGGFSWREYDEQFRLRQAISPASWSQINNDLWWRCMQVKDAPKLVQSRTRRFTCNDFNSGNCSWPNCKFLHACSTCSAYHPEIACTQYNSSVGFQSTRPRGNFQNRPFRRPFRGQGRGRAQR